jgi:hypothetical protein
MTPSDGIGTARMLLKGPSLLQTMDLDRGGVTLGKKQTFRPPLAMGGNFLHWPRITMTPSFSHVGYPPASHQAT